jgi:hypothetical protein
VPVIIVKKINGRALSLNHLIADDIIAKVVIVSPHRKKKKTRTTPPAREPPTETVASYARHPLFPLDIHRASIWGAEHGEAERRELVCPLMLHCVQRTARPVITFTSHQRCETQCPRRPRRRPRSPGPTAFFSRRQLGTRLTFGAIGSRSRSDSTD